MCSIGMKYGFPYVRSNVFQKQGNVRRIGYLSPEMVKKLFTNKSFVAIMNEYIDTM